MSRRAADSCGSDIHVPQSQRSSDPVQCTTVLLNLCIAADLTAKAAVARKRKLLQCRGTAQHTASSLLLVQNMMLGLATSRSTLVPMRLQQFVRKMHSWLSYRCALTSGVRGGAAQLTLDPCLSMLRVHQLSASCFKKLIEDAVQLALMMCICFALYGVPAQIASAQSCL